MLKVAIICDSHGSDYGCESYSTRVKKDNTLSIHINVFAGISTDKILNQLQLDENYDVIILQIGNPDIHPRMPKRLMAKLKKIAPKLAKDSLFSIPPKRSLSFFLRYPFFILRRIIIKRMRKKEFYVTEDILKNNLAEIIARCKSNSNTLYIIPLFEVLERIYGDDHNKKAQKINQWLSNEYRNNYIDSTVFSSDFYKEFYNIDYFHFKNKYHDIIANLILNKIHERGNYESAKET
ncbi:SGNH/GDSL hydrolase family protein [Clostridium cellulovorans]|uniref:SGNH hydrolase-type esterase domain-containing protein n=1 Tax=Clostridium cellulovorans (strain ATCC 35296 / DSM 3052 / OCM 3 / 743B) TaxID=573061 RepID=D9SNX5_CLOC7|nr:SGNH/GDSL hydrolase family protein [Clostridium cellulovorans]ADL51940.1 hypothetical protein Clocel_2200 [Clostridium cellulovorans 743B]